MAVTLQCKRDKELKAKVKDSSKDVDERSSAPKKGEDSRKNNVVYNQEWYWTISFYECCRTIALFQMSFYESLIRRDHRRNNYARQVLRPTQITGHSIWQSWREVEMEEFWAFFRVILNMGTVLHRINRNTGWYSTTVEFFISFTPNVVTGKRIYFLRKRFNHMFWCCI